MEHAAKAFRGHLQPLTIEEDEEKIVVTMNPCGSGKRIILKGACKEGLAGVKNPHGITWGTKDFPISCVHCPVIEMLTIESTGDFGAVHAVYEPIPLGSCHFTFYKDLADIPQEFYDRLGKIKPV